MNNKKISQLATVSYKDSLLLPAIDMDMPTGAQNVNIFAASIHTGAGLIGPTGPTGPQGVQGPQGLAGIGLNFRGTWVSGSLYVPSDYVFDTGATAPSSMWILQDATNYLSTIRPKDDRLHWAEYTAPPGPTGPVSFNDAPNDIQTYGRHATTWIPVLPLSGGTVAGSLNVTTSLSVGGSAPISGFGMAIGQVPIFSNRGSRPSFELNGQWIINQAAPTGSQGADVFIR